MDLAVAEPVEAARRLLCDAVRIVDKDNPAGTPRHEAYDLGLQPAVRDVDREQRMTRSVLAFLAHIEEGDLAAIGEPSSQPRDVDGGGHRHALPASGREINIAWVTTDCPSISIT
jgi:hypothetical protein